MTGANGRAKRRLHKTTDRAVRPGFRAVEDISNNWSSVDVANFPSASMKTKAGVTISEETALENCATAFACTRALAETLATLPAVVYRRRGDGSRERAADTRAWHLLHDRPNRLWDATTCYDQGTVRLVNRGNCFFEIERDQAGRPLALWPIHPSRVRGIRMPGDTVEWYVQVDDLDMRSNTRSKGTYYMVPAANMLNVVGFNSKDGFFGSGAVKHAMQEMGLDVASQRYGASWFGNGARPSGIISHPGFIKDDDRRKEFRTDINRLYASEANWNSVAVLWDGAKWERLEVSPEEAQFIGTRQWQAKVLCRLWNVPPAIVQIYDEFKFSSVEAMIRCFIMLSIRPLCVRWERATNNQMLRMPTDNDWRLVDAYGESLFLEFELGGLLRGDPKTQAEADVLHVQWGIATPDEIRRRDNRNGYEDGAGQQALAPLNYTTLDRIERGETIRQNGGRREESAQAGQFDASVLMAGAGLGMPDASQADRRYAQFAERVLDEQYKRLLRIEVKRVKEAAGKGSAHVASWLDQFYASWVPQLSDALILPVEGWMDAVGVKGDSTALANSLAASHCASSRVDLLHELKGSSATLAQRVAAVTEKWFERSLVLSA